MATVIDWPGFKGCVKATFSAALSSSSTGFTSCPFTRKDCTWRFPPYESRFVNRLKYTSGSVTVSAFVYVTTCVAEYDLRSGATVRSIRYGGGGGKDST